MVLFLMDSPSNTPSVLNNLITYNTVTANGAGGVSQGGGVFVQHVEGYLANNIISHNSSDVGYSYGGGVCLFQSKSLFVNNTIVNNSTNYGGGGFFNCWGDDSVMVNSILWGNTASLGSNVFLYTPEYSPITTFEVDYSDFEGGAGSVHLNDPDSVCTWGSNNISSDPLFVDFANDDYHLTFPSLCRDAGDNSVVTEAYDFEGDPRFGWGGYR